MRFWDKMLFIDRQLRIEYNVSSSLWSSSSGILTDTNVPVMDVPAMNVPVMDVVASVECALKNTKDVSLEESLFFVPFFSVCQNT